MVGGGDLFYLKFWVNRPRWGEIADFQPIIARSASAVRPSEISSINTNRKTLRAFQRAWEWSSYIAPKSPKGGSKRKTAVFPLFIAFRLKKVCYKVSLCENCQRQSCRAFIAITIHAKLIGGGTSLLPEILGQSDRVGAKSPIFDLFSFLAPQPYDLEKKFS